MQIGPGYIDVGVELFKSKETPKGNYQKRVDKTPRGFPKAECGCGF
jgi:hypothetical protein